jgi:energy-coupling factor transporter transmembrane protein EcfT
MAFVAGKSMKAADDVYDAMIARGYSGAMRSVRRLSAGLRDLAWIAVAVGVAALTLGLDRMVSPR